MVSLNLYKQYLNVADIKLKILIYRSLFCVIMCTSYKLFKTIHATNATRYMSQASFM